MGQNGTWLIGVWNLPRRSQGTSSVSGLTPFQMTRPFIHSSPSMMRSMSFSSSKFGNEVDSNRLRERLGMQRMKSYKTGKLSKSNVIDVNDVRTALEGGMK